ncbi:hypothetical protein [Sulfurimonas sp.]|uniref:hypothetical protein n=1 Tax=Sulfurimonas sp. TaxID=2022749 RepID=UPI002AB28527|nr:hypothetical protein [Sulfurimonas sp.]
MKFFFILLMTLSSILLASDTTQETKMDKEIQKQIEKEKRYAKEQTFYKGKDYNLKSFEVNPDAIKSIPKSNIDYSDGDNVLEMD